MKEIILSLLSSKMNSLSSKRFIGVLAAVSLIVIAFVDLFTDFTITENVYDNVMWLAVAGLGFVASERFADIWKPKNSEGADKDQTPPTE